MRRFWPAALEQELTLKFFPLRRDAPIYIQAEFWPDFGAREFVVAVREIAAAVEYERVVRSA